MEQSAIGAEEQSIDKGQNANMTDAALADFVADTVAKRLQAQLSRLEAQVTQLRLGLPQQPLQVPAAVPPQQHVSLAMAAAAAAASPDTTGMCITGTSSTQAFLMGGNSPGSTNPPTRACTHELQPARTKEIVSLDGDDEGPTMGSDRVTTVDDPEVHDYLTLTYPSAVEDGMVLSKTLTPMSESSHQKQEVVRFQSFAEDLKREVDEGAVARCMEANEPKREGPLADFVQSTQFANSCFCVIICNTIFTFYVTNYGAVYKTNTTPLWTYVVEMFFLSFYTFEVLLKIANHRIYFFWNSDWAWNCLDFIIVVVAFGELIFDVLFSVDFIFMRAIRVLRITKFLRIFRMLRFLSTLRLMMGCILGSIASLMWAGLLLLLILMIASLTFVQGMTAVRVNGDISLEQEGAIRDSFGSVPSGMITMLMCSTGGQDWKEVFNMIELSGKIEAGFFMFYIVFFTFAFVNIVTSIFVDQAMKLAQPDFESRMLEKRRRDLDAAKDLRDVLMDSTDDGQKTGTITKEQLKKVGNDMRFRRSLDYHDLDMREAEQFFDTLVLISHNDSIDIDTFVAGCLKMKGVASSIDVQALMFEVRGISEVIEKINRRTEHQDTSRKSRVHGYAATHIPSTTGSEHFENRATRRTHASATPTSRGSV